MTDYTREAEQAYEALFSQSHAPVKAIEFLVAFPFLPVSVMTEPYKRPSNSELRRWLNDKAVRINGMFPDAGDIVEYPITDLVCFPNGKRKTTMMAKEKTISITGEIKEIEGENIYYPLEVK